MHVIEFERRKPFKVQRDEFVHVLWNMICFKNKLGNLKFCLDYWL